jgi:hypothetical protein
MSETAERTFAIAGRTCETAGKMFEMLDIRVAR